MEDLKKGMESLKISAKSKDMRNFGNCEMTLLYIEVPETKFCLEFLHRKYLKKVLEGMKISANLLHFNILDFDEQK